MSRQQRALLHSSIRQHKGLAPMSDAPQESGDQYVSLAADIVSAYVSKNSVRPSEIPELIASVHSTLTKVVSGTAEKPKEELHPPVSIKKSITPDFLISL